MKEIYYHEDDYCQIEILPISNWQHCAQQMGEIQTFSESHQAPGGLGWTDMYIRSESPVSLRQSNVTLESLKQALANIAEESGPVYTGYSTYRELSKNTIAFCTSPGVALYADYNDDRIVEHIWFTLDVTSQEVKNSMLTMFEHLSSLGDFLLADWGWCTLIQAKDTTTLDAYLSKRIEVFSGLRTQFRKSRKWWQFWKQKQ